MCVNISNYQCKHPYEFVLNQKKPGENEYLQISLRSEANLKQILTNLTRVMTFPL